MTRERAVRLEPPVRIVVTGDTHFSPRRNSLPDVLTEAMTASDLTIHCGDFCTRACQSMFEAHGPVLAVSGNNDEAELADVLPNRLRIEAGDVRLIVTHGHRERGSSARHAVQRSYVGQADIVIFGHSHQPIWEEVDDTWFLNPGSPTMKRREPRFSFATLEIDRDGAFNAFFTYFD